MKRLLVLMMTLTTLLCLTFAACGAIKDNGKVEPTTYTVTISVENSGYGTVSKSTVEKVAKDTAITVNGATLSVGDTVITATPAQATAQYTYAFDSFVFDGTTVTGNMTVTVRFTRTTNQYTIHFEMGEGAPIDDMTVNYGTPVSELAGVAVTPPANYRFDKWQLKVGEGNYVDFDGTEVLESDITVKACYVSDTYAIIFLNEDGTELQNTEVASGTTPTYNGATPTKAADAQYTYTFAGWTPAITAVTGPATYTATFDAEVNEYEIRFVDEDGTELQVSPFEYGETPVFVGEDPVKAATVDTVYTFAGWTPAIATVTGGATYTATYTSATREYDVVFVNYDGAELQSGKVAYGATPEYTGATPAKAADAEYAYEFAGWTPAIAAVSGDATYTATFSTVAIVDPANEIIVDKSKAATADISYLNLSSEVTGVKVNGETSDKITVEGNTVTVADGLLGEDIEVMFITAEEKVITHITVVSYNITSSAEYSAWAASSVDGWSMSMGNSGFGTYASELAPQYVILSADVDLDGAVYGVRYCAIFKGTFNGRGHTVSNFQWRNSLFGNGVWTADSVVKNVAFVNFTSVNDSDQSILASRVYGTVSNVYMSGDLSGQTTQANTIALIYDIYPSGRLENVVVNFYNSNLDNTPAISYWAENGASATNVFVAMDNYSGNAYTNKGASFVETNVKVYDNIIDLNADLDDIIAALGDIYDEYYTTYNGTIVFKTATDQMLSNYSFTDAYTEAAYKEGAADAILTTDFTVSRWELVGELATAGKVTVADGAITVTEGGHAGETVTVNAYYMSKAFGMELLGASKEISIGKDVSTVEPDSELIVDLSKATTADITYLGLDGAVTGVKVNGAATDKITVDGTTMNVASGATLGENLEVVFETATAAVSTHITVVNLAIATKADMIDFMTNYAGVSVTGKYVIMTANVNFGGDTWNYASESGCWFAGTFNGRGFTFYNVVFAKSFIANISGTGTVIKNLAIVNAKISGRVGPLITRTRALLDNIYIECDFSGMVDDGTFNQPLTYEIDNRADGTNVGEVRNIILVATNFTKTTAFAKVTRYTEGPMTNVHVLIDKEIALYNSKNAKGVITNSDVYYTADAFKAVVNADNATVTDAFDTSENGYWKFDANGMLIFKTSEVLTYTVTFVVDNDGYGTVNTESIENVAKGTAISFDGGAILTVGDTEVMAKATDNNAQYTYAFVGFDYTGDTVTGDMVITAMFTRTLNKYTVSFEMGDGTAIEDMLVDYGTAVSELDSIPVTPPENYHFVKWQLKVSEGVYVDFDGTETLEGNITVKAVYEENLPDYEIVFEDEDGTELQVSQVAHGEMPVYNGATPTKAADAQYTYTFAGWSPEITAAAGNATYTATYNATVNEYAIKFVDEDGESVLQNTDVAYGETPVYAGATPVKAATAQYVYEFAGWTPEIVSVTGTATYTATFDAYTIVDPLSEVIVDLSKGGTADITYLGLTADVTAVKIGGAATDKITVDGTTLTAVSGVSLGEGLRVYFVTANEKVVTTMTIVTYNITNSAEYSAWAASSTASWSMSMGASGFGTYASGLAPQYVILSTDVDLGGAVYGVRYCAVFKGTFNGRGHTVSNFQWRNCLFGYGIWTSDSVVKNVAFVNFTSVNDSDQPILFNRVYGTASNIYMSGDLSGQTSQANTIALIYDIYPSGRIENIVVNFYNSNLDKTPAISYWAENGASATNVFVAMDNYSGKAYTNKGASFAETNVEVYDSIIDMNAEITDIIDYLGDVYTEYYTMYRDTIVFKTAVDQMEGRFTDAYTTVSYKEGAADATLTTDMAPTSWVISDYSGTLEEEDVTCVNGVITIVESGHAGETFKVTVTFNSDAFGGEVTASKVLTIGKDVVTVVPSGEILVETGRGSADITELGLTSAVTSIKIAGAVTDKLSVVGTALTAASGAPLGENLEVVFETDNEIVSTTITIVSLAIANKADMTTFMTDYAGVSVTGVYVIMTADVDYEGGTWNYANETGSWYVGTFDGRGHTLYNVIFAKSFIANINTAGTVIKNVAITGAKVTGRVGPLITRTRALLDNIYIECDFSGMFDDGTFNQPLTYEIDAGGNLNVGEIRNVILIATNYTKTTSFAKVMRWCEGPATNLYVLIDKEIALYASQNARGILTNCGVYYNVADFKAVVKSDNATVTDAFDTSENGYWKFDANGMLIFKTAEGHSGIPGSAFTDAYTTVSYKGGESDATLTPNFTVSRWEITDLTGTLEAADITNANGVITIAEGGHVGDTFTVNAYHTDVTGKEILGASRVITVGKDVSIVNPLSEVLLAVGGSSADISYLGLVGEVTSIKVAGAVTDKLSVVGTALTAVSGAPLGEDLEVVFETASAIVSTRITIATVISTKAELMAWKTAMASVNTENLAIANPQYVILSADIDCEGEEFYLRYNVWFNGTFDGRGHTISNFQKKHALFGAGLTAGSVVKNVAFVDFTCQNDDQPIFVTRVRSGATVSNVFVSGDIAGQTTIANTVVFIYDIYPSAVLENLIANLYNSNLATRPAIAHFAESGASAANVYVMMDSYNGEKYASSSGFVETNVQAFNNETEYKAVVNSSNATVTDAFDTSVNGIWMFDANGMLIFKTSDAVLNPVAP